MFTSLASWLLRPYVSFQYNKSSIKKLYKYSRTKRRKRTMAEKIQLAHQMKIEQEEPENTQNAKKFESESEPDSKAMMNID